jgi:hypothetical protein
MEQHTQQNTLRVTQAYILSKNGKLSLWLSTTRWRCMRQRTYSNAEECCFGTRLRRTVSFTFRLLYPRCLRYAMARRLGGHTADADQLFHDEPSLITQPKLSFFDTNVYTPTPTPQKFKIRLSGSEKLLRREEESSLNQS